MVGWFCPTNSEVEVLNPRTLEGDRMWREVAADVVGDAVTWDQGGPEPL